MTDLNKLRSEFESNEYIKSIIQNFEWSEEFNNYQIKDCVINGNIFDLLEAKNDEQLLNGAWFGWQEKAKAQAVPNEIINEIQSWIAVQSTQAMELDGEEFVVGANELAEFIENLVKSESGAEQ
ncbi:hypothetical protein [Acinetobacter baumannii]|uniref:hypothetical protein n=1 Tax=Acinetobacter baumannii TaxID=470 RepID=UPI00344E8DB2